MISYGQQLMNGLRSLRDRPALIVPPLLQTVFTLVLGGGLFLLGAYLISLTDGISMIEVMLGGATSDVSMRIALIIIGIGLVIGFLVNVAIRAGWYKMLSAYTATGAMKKATGRKKFAAKKLFLTGAREFYAPFLKLELIIFACKFIAFLPLLFSFLLFGLGGYSDVANASGLVLFFFGLAWLVIVMLVQAFFFLFARPLMFIEQRGCKETLAGSWTLLKTKLSRVLLTGLLVFVVWVLVTLFFMILGQVLEVFVASTGGAILMWVSVFFQLFQFVLFLLVQVVLAVFLFGAYRELTTKKITKKMKKKA